MTKAGELVTKRIVIGYPEQRLAYLSEQIAACHAQYCAVLEPGSATLIGLVTFSELAASASTVNRIFADLMLPPPSHCVAINDSKKSGKFSRWNAILAKSPSCERTAHFSD